MAVQKFQLLPEERLREMVETLVRLVEAAGAIVIFAGAVVAVFLFLRALPKRDTRAFVSVRLTLGRFLALGLEFQLASDILETAVAPSFEELAKLAIVAAIRTALNFFLAREIKEEQETLRRDQEDDGAQSGEAPATTASGSSAR